MALARARASALLTARALLHLWWNGERKLIVAFGISVVAMGIIVSTLVYQFAPGREHRAMVIGLGEPSAPLVHVGDVVGFKYNQCNHTGQDGTSLVFASWVRIAETGDAFIASQNAMGGASLVTLPAPRGCRLVVSNPVPVPIGSGKWQRVGLAITVFPSQPAELAVISTRPIEVTP